MKFHVDKINEKSMKFILLLLGFTCFGAGEDTYKVPEGKPRIFFDGTMWRTVSVGHQTTVQRARQRLPDLSKVFEMSDVNMTQEIQELKNNTTYNVSVVHNLVNKIMEGIKIGLRNSNIKEAFTTQTTPRPYPLHLFDWLLGTSTTSRKSYLDFLETTTDKNQEPDDIQTIDAADLWYGTEPTRKRKRFHRNMETKLSQANVQVQSSTKRTPRLTIRNQKSIRFNTTTPKHKKDFDQRIKKLYDLLTSYKEALDRTAVPNEEKIHSFNKTRRQDNSQIQIQIDELKDNRNKLIALILDLLNKLKVILARKSNSGRLTVKNFDNKNPDDIQKIVIKEKDPMNARKVAQEADLLFSELSYNVDLSSGDVLSDTEIIGDMEDIDVRNEKYMSRMFGLNSNEPKESINPKEIYDYSQFEDPGDRSGGVEYETRFKIYNRTERGNILI